MQRRLPRCVADPVRASPGEQVAAHWHSTTGWLMAASSGLCCPGPAPILRQVTDAQPHSRIVSSSSGSTCRDNVREVLPSKWQECCRPVGRGHT